MGTILKPTNAIVGMRTYSAVNRGDIWLYQIAESFICIPMYYCFDMKAKNIQYYWVQPNK